MINRTPPAEAATQAANAAIYRAAAAARNTERAAAADALRKAHPELVSPTPERDGLVTAARNLRAQLKARWPGVKFSVRTDRFSGGDALRVSWTDGPTRQMVESIARRYTDGSFDGMTDSYTYTGSPWSEAFGDAKYVSCSRNYSPAAEAWAKVTFGQGENPHDWDQPWREALADLSIKRLK